MTRYRRSYGGKVTVSLSWSTTIGAYELKFDNAFNQWDKVQAIIAWIKMTVPSSERDYDPDTKIWTLHEKFFTFLKGVLDTVDDFDTSVFEKPDASSYGQTKFVPLDEYTNLFKFVTGMDIKTMEFKDAQKVYRIHAMRMHPDKNPDDASSGQKMAEFNEAWDVIKERHYKIVRVMEQVQ
jgi:hypothetical protein